MGTTNLISAAPTAYNPQAALLIPTETPFNSIGNDGERFESDASLLLTVTLEGARLTLDCRNPCSAGAKPTGASAGTPARRAPNQLESVASDYRSA
jgi:hypothetical protein